MLMEGLPICFTVPIRSESDKRERIHTHHFHELVYVLDGEGRQATDRTSYDVRPGDFYIFPAEVPHAAFCSRGEHQLLFVLYVPDAYFAASQWDYDLARAWNQLITIGRSDHRIDLEPDRATSEHARTIVESLSREFREKRPGYRAACRLLISEFLLLLMRSAWWQTHIPEHPASPSPRQLMHEAESYIHANWFREIRVDDVLAVCNLSRSHFHSLFRRHTQQTFVGYLNAIRIEHAKRLLAETDRNVNEIASQCGFARPAYFSSMFREQVGMPPREYRRHLIEAESYVHAVDVFSSRAVHSIEPSLQE
ncbi:MAG: AraC family transcriptional regulator [Spirochaetaceae bacterium]|nr:MAG: AraC family transcriptional regulator [Spirochaetaceae bacterium]